MKTLDELVLLKRGINLGAVKTKNNCAIYVNNWGGNIAKFVLHPLGGFHVLADIYLLIRYFFAVKIPHSHVTKSASW